MKTLRLLDTYLLLSAMLFAVMLASCSKEDDPVEITTNMGQVALQYNAEGVWADVATNRNFSLQYLIFNHEGSLAPQGFSCMGFTPARYVGLDYVAVSDWSRHPFMIPSKGGVAGVGTPYVVACWNTQENETTPAASRSLRITYAADAQSPSLPFTPKEVYVELTCYSLSALQQGQWITLTAHGVKANGGETTCQIYLADLRGDSQTLLDAWTRLDLSPLGEVTELYFTLQGNDTGEWGLLTPPWFALDRLTIKAPLPS